MSFPEMVHDSAADDKAYVVIHEDTPSIIVQQMLNIRESSGNTNYVKIVACEWKGKECTTSHLLRDCPFFKKKQPKERMKHIQVSGRCFNCMRKEHSSKDCRSPIRCSISGCGARHNVALHDACQEKTQAVALLTRNVALVALLTSPVIISSETSALKFETNVIQDNGASVSLCSKALADSIGLKGEERPLGLSFFGNPNHVQQAFKKTILVANTEGTNDGKAIVHVVPEFVDLKAIDWSEQAKDFPHLRTVNYPTPF
jgi:hypothetical protein